MTLAAPTHIYPSTLLFPHTGLDQSRGRLVEDEDEDEDEGNGPLYLKKDEVDGE